MQDTELSAQPAGEQRNRDRDAISRGHTFVQDLYRRDKKAPPEILLETSRDPSLGTDPVPSDRYFSREFYAVEK
ncbi:hypothetical protein SAMN06295937_10501, partial [Sphingopyxis flava]